MSRKPAATGVAVRTLDDEGRSIIYDGCSLGQLGIIFGLDNRDIARRIKEVLPSGERIGYPIYRIADVAPYLVPADMRDVSAAIKRMSPKDLPPSLTKEYWAGQHARLKFEEDQGDLWRTADVVETFSEVFKTLRMSILLLRDQLERQDELTTRQRDIIQKLIDGLLNDLADSLTKRFEHEPGSRSGEQWAEPDAEDSAEAL